MKVASGCSSTMEYQASDNGKSVIKTIMQTVDESKFSETTLFHTVYVGGIGPIKTTIDSDYVGCAISLDLLTDAIISKVDPINKNCLFALHDPNKKFVLGYVDLDVNYLGQTVKKLPFYVVNKLDVPMILGASWIGKSCAILQSDGTKLQVLLGEKKKRKWYSELFGTDDDDNYLPSGVSVEVDDGGIGPLRARVSTGIAQSVIGRDLLTELQLSKVIQINDTASTWTNDELKIDGPVSLNVTYEGMKTCVENVLVVSGLDYPSMLFLGMDWINKSRVVIQAKGSNITVSTPHIPDQK